MKFQIGKHGITLGVLESLSLAFKKHKSVKISVLRNSGINRERIRDMAKELSGRLRKFAEENDKKRQDYVYKIVGFTITLRRVSRQSQTKSGQALKSLS